MYCSQCGTDNHTGVVTCTLCGSPLTPRSGPDTCPRCGDPVDRYDRFCQQCGTTLPSEPAGFDAPGAAFGDDDLADVDLGALPPWLQDLATTTPGPAPAPTPTPAAQAPAASGIDEAGLPEWLVAARTSDHASTVGETAAASTATLQATGGAVGTFTLVGEDDLPEWLRVLGDEEPAGPSGYQPQVVSAAPAPAAIAAVPSVSRAWLARPRTVDVEAEVAARRAFDPIEAEPASAPVKPEAPAQPVVAAVAPAVGPVPASGADARTRRVRILILLLGLAVIALMVALWYTGKL